MLPRAPAQWFFLGVCGLALAVGMDGSLRAADAAVAPTGPVATSLAAPQIADLQKELADLLAKDSAGPVRPYNETRNAPPPRLSRSERDRLGTLLRNPDLAQSVTLDQVLANIKLHQEEGTVMDVDAPDLEALMEMLNLRWAKDPAVIAFYRDALATRGGAAITDLESLRNIWDDSFIEPLVKDIETIAPVVASGQEDYSHLPVAEWPSDILSRGLALLDQHYVSWAKDATIAPRLSKAVLLANPELTGAAAANQQPGSQNFRNALSMLAPTHDRAMIAVLRPFLSNKTVDAYGLYSQDMPLDRTALRVCDLAANAICTLLGEQEMFNPYTAATAPRGGPYPEWTDWDQKIADLEKRLDALPKN